MDKRELRQAYLSRRREMSLDAVKRSSLAICKDISSTAWFQRSKRLLMYMPIRREVDLRPLMDVAWRKGKTVYLPKADPVTHAMDAYAVHSLDELKAGAYGILEPSADATKEADLEKLDCVFIPGVVFDRQGYRIGYGGGYYDRFLPRLTSSTLLIGVAYAWQVVERIPRDAYDEPLHVLVTEKEVLTFSLPTFTKHSRRTRPE